MAATNYITLDTTKPLGAQIVAVHDNLVNLTALVEQLFDTLGQVNADGNLAAVIGAATADNATAVLNLVGGVVNDLNDVGNAFAQYSSRIGRASF